MVHFKRGIYAMKKSILLILMISIAVLSACTAKEGNKEKTSSKPTGSVTASDKGQVVITVDGQITAFPQATFKAESVSGNFLATQIHAVDMKKVCAIGWYKIKTPAEVIPNTYNIEPLNVYLLYQDRNPDLQTYNSQSGKIIVEKNDGNSIKGTFDTTCQDNSTKKTIQISGSFDVTYAK
jgi:hypothetical protein